MFAVSQPCRPDSESKSERLGRIVWLTEVFSQRINHLVTTTFVNEFLLVLMAWQMSVECKEVTPFVAEISG
jgi:hypothetical protein